MKTQITRGELKITYEHGLPHGIRDKGGYLFFFTKPPKFSGQEERYREDCERMFKLADFLLEALKTQTLMVSNE